MRRTYSVIAIALSVSLFIYLFYRTTKTVVNELIVLLLSPATYSEIRTIIADAIPLNDPVLFSLPGGLWVFGLTILSKELYLQVNRYKLQLAFLPVGFAVGLEFFQLLQVTKGTFDPVDIGFYIVFWLLAYFGFKSASSQQNILSPFNFRGFVCVACFLSVYLAHVSQ
jgi:hypothetical protein